MSATALKSVFGMVLNTVFGPLKKYGTPQGTLPKLAIVVLIQKKSKGILQRRWVMLGSGCCGGGRAWGPRALAAEPAAAAGMWCWKSGNAAREYRGASSCSPFRNLLLLPKCPCRAQGHSGTPHVGACYAGRPGRRCASASRRRKLDPGSRFVSRGHRPSARPHEDLPVRRRGLVLGAGGRACQAESASGSGHRVPNHSLTFMCRCVPVI